MTGLDGFCDNCKEQKAFLNKSPEGQYSDCCHKWFCDDCIKWEKCTDGLVICINCEGKYQDQREVPA